MAHFASLVKVDWSPAPEALANFAAAAAQAAKTTLAEQGVDEWCDLPLSK